MQISHEANRATSQSDEALAKEFAEYIGVVSDSIVRSQIKHDFGAIEQLIRIAKDELAPLQETVQLSTKIVGALNDVRSRLHEIPDELRKSLQTLIGNLDAAQRSAFTKNTDSSVQKLSDATNRLIKELQHETSRYLEGFSEAPVAMAELGNNINRAIDTSVKAIIDETRRASAANESRLRSVVEDNVSATIKGIHACSKDVEQARSQIQIELRARADQIVTGISDAQRSMMDEIAQRQAMLLAALGEAETRNRVLFEKQSKEIVEQTIQTDQRILTMQRWLWGICGSSLLAIIILLFKVFR